MEGGFLPEIDEKSGLAALAEKLLHQPDAVGRQDSFDDFYPVVQQVGIRQAELASHASETQIARAEHQPGNTGVYQRSGAHHAGLQSDVQRGACQAVIAERGRTLAESLNLGVRSGILRRNRRVAAPAYQLSSVIRNGLRYSR